METAVCTWMTMCHDFFFVKPVLKIRSTHTRLHCSSHCEVLSGQNRQLSVFVQHEKVLKLQSQFLFSGPSQFPTSLVQSIESEKRDHQQTELPSFQRGLVKKLPSVIIFDCSLFHQSWHSANASLWLFEENQQQSTLKMWTPNRHNYWYHIFRAVRHI